jgi:hypothetical protein
MFGDRSSQCSNNYDEYLYGHGRALSQFKCDKSHIDDCQLLKEYIKNSSLISNSSIDLYSNMPQSQYQSKNKKIIKININVKQDNVFL